MKKNDIFISKEEWLKHLLNLVMNHPDLSSQILIDSWHIPKDLAVQLMSCLLTIKMFGEDDNEN